MAKTFNGQKGSHGQNRGARPICMICGKEMTRLLGEFRCAERRRSRSGDDRWHIIHGSERTARKRLRQAAAKRNAAS